MSAQRSVNLGMLGLRVFIVLVVFFLLLPILAIVPISFTSGELVILPVPGWSMRWYQSLWSNPAWGRALANSLIVGLSSTALATVIGTSAALGLAYRSLRGRAFISALIMSPMIVPIVIVAVGMFMSFSLVGLTSSYLGLILGHTVISVPLVVITVSATLQVYDERLTSAAASLGASPLRAFRFVTLPLILPGVASGAIFAFNTSFDDVVLALFLGGPAQRTLPREIFSGVRENTSPAIAAVAVMLILMSIALMIVMEALRARSRRLTTDSDGETN